MKHSTISERGQSEVCGCGLFIKKHNIDINGISAAD